MSKVKHYMDINKTKARHRNRIDETRRTKANRIRKCKNETYSWIRGGYYHVTEREIYRYEYFDVPEQRGEFMIGHWNKGTDECVWKKEIRIIPAHIGRKLIETTITPVSILKRGSTRRAKFLKTQAKRRFRRNVNVSEENYCILKGNSYRKDYEIKRAVW